MKSSDYECVVIGVGGVGSAALYHLALRGVRVLGVDRFEPGHDRGSSHGDTRVTRLAYFEHPSYVPLLRRASVLWRQLEQASGESLYQQTGVLEVGPPDGEVIPGVLRAAKIHGLAIESLSAADVEARFPGFRVPSGLCGVFEHEGGVLAVESCVQTHTALAVEQGADLWANTPVDGWRFEKGTFFVETSEGTVRTPRLVITAGAWSAELLSHLGISLKVRRKVLLWYGADPGAYAVSDGSPVFLYELPSGVFYGFPQLDAHGVKVAAHDGGTWVQDPLKLDRRVDARDRDRVEDFIRDCLPLVHVSEPRRDSVCMYTMSDDLHFVVDHEPACPGLVYAAGLSGHGFKFSGVLGEVLAERVMTGGAPLPPEVFSAGRSSLHRGSG